ncbi:MAG: phosphate/phosphite/phosphonate ABC transporter substrate-binding protein [Helicobacteraceae bacterium]|nr:phosphate/phosphite/phosphonate ABC transporter substrate-binding protein [Candidatus Sulfurimonas ponti]MBL6973821.1 phosphate/phosphite/phosphonate ABC transporter substrate-binding protein [Sulfurimonas sp.]
MKLIILLLILSLSHALASDKLVFGAISTIDPYVMKKKLSPIINYLEMVTGKKVEFQTGYDYTDTIKKFADGTFDIGYIGPAPYVITKQINPESIHIVAGLVNDKNKPFQSVIISKKGSDSTKLDDIKNRRFAFGSPQSTLSYFVPMNMLIKADVVNKVKSYDFLGRHDKVAQYIIMGKYDVGAVKKSVAEKYSKYIQVVASSQELPDFMIVANNSVQRETVEKIKHALLNLKDAQILKSLKASAVGFEERKDSDYDDLRLIIENVKKYK